MPPICCLFFNRVSMDTLVAGAHVVGVVSRPAVPGREEISSVEERGMGAG